MSAITTLRLFGFVQKPNPSFKSIFIAAILQLSMVAIYMDTILLYVIAATHDNLLTKIIIEKVYSISTTVVVMVMLIRKKRSLTKLLSKTDFICHPFSEKMINIITSWIFILLFSYGAAYIFIHEYSEDDYPFVFFFYKIPLESEWSWCFAFCAIVVVVLCEICPRNWRNVHRRHSPSMCKLSISSAEEESSNFWKKHKTFFHLQYSSFVRQVILVVSQCWGK
ncbi:hypothetical protein NPIL_168711 [Nephila pilipes]|uniref:Uncharacterized protein n=1 Tax=Nephila pilipes TaxID=299642 RepID=A0A8X6U2M8_NEPPI|nr:hypothetical protein NPIL_168711 [Nephila pilipes]